MGFMLDRIGTWLGRTLTRPVHTHGIGTVTPSEDLLRCLQPSDVLLVEGHSRISTAIKYPVKMIASARKLGVWRPD